MLSVRPAPQGIFEGQCISKATAYEFCTHGLNEYHDSDFWDKSYLEEIGIVKSAIVKELDKALDEGLITELTHYLKVMELAFDPHYSRSKEIHRMLARSVKTFRNISDILVRLYQQLGSLVFDYTSMQFYQSEEYKEYGFRMGQYHIMHEDVYKMIAYVEEV